MDLADAGLGPDPGRGDDCGAEQIAVLGDRLPGVHPDPDSYRLGGGGVVGREGPLQGDGTFHGGHRRPERSHEAVTHGLDLDPAVSA